MKPAVIGFENISERLCTMLLRGKFRNISLINVHAPTEETAEPEKDTFYEAVEQTLEACPRYDIKIILGDFNSQVGRATYSTETLALIAYIKIQMITDCGLFN